MEIKKSRSDGDEDENRIINEDGDEESKILPKYDSFSSLIIQMDHFD